MSIVAEILLIIFLAGIFTELSKILGGIFTELSKIRTCMEKQTHE